MKQKFSTLQDILDQFMEQARTEPVRTGAGLAAGVTPPNAILYTRPRVRRRRRARGRVHP